MGKSARTVGDLVGIESDQIVFDYLSRIGDLAHSTRMSAAERAKLVGGVRGEIDKARAADGGAENKAAVKKILNRLGRPEDIVAAANGGEGPALPTPTPTPSPSEGEGAAVKGEPETPTIPAPRGEPSAAYGASSPHLAGMDELSDEESDPDWWRVDPSPYGSGASGTGGVAAGEPVPGFVGGIELPEILKPPPPKPGEEEEKEPPKEAVPEGGSPAKRGAAYLRRSLGKRVPKAPGGPRSGGFVELAAAALLVAGAVTGSFVPLALGWLAAWWSPKLSRIEAKWAAFGMPGVVLGLTAIWLWGRTEGRWGAPIAEGGDAMRDAMGGTFPILLRVAAGASAAYLVWRARRPAK